MEKIEKVLSPQKTIKPKLVSLKDTGKSKKPILVRPRKMSKSLGTRKLDPYDINNLGLSDDEFGDKLSFSSKRLSHKTTLTGLKSLSSFGSDKSIKQIKNKKHGLDKTVGSQRKNSTAKNLLDFSNKNKANLENGQSKVAKVKPSKAKWKSANKLSGLLHLDDNKENIDPNSNVVDKLSDDLTNSIVNKSTNVFKSQRMKKTNDKKTKSIELLTRISGQPIIINRNSMGKKEFDMIGSNCITPNDYDRMKNLKAKILLPLPQNSFSNSVEHRLMGKTPLSVVRKPQIASTPALPLVLSDSTDNSVPFEQEQHLTKSETSKSSISLTAVSNVEHSSKG